MAKDREWLKQRLCEALGWDGVVVEGVVEAISSAETTQEVDSIVQVRDATTSSQNRASYLTKLAEGFVVQDYMGGSAQPKQLVHDFLRAQGKILPAAGNTKSAVSCEGLSACLLICNRKPVLPILKRVCLAGRISILSGTTSGCSKTQC